MNFLKIIIYTIIISFSCLAGAIFFLANNKSINFSSLEYYNDENPSIAYDDNGEEWTRFQLDRREIVSYKDIPEHVIKAFLAAEDWNFFQHSGISLKGIFRSIFVNLYHRKKVQGASTITQQLVKLLFFSSQKSYIRKIKEQFLSIVVELQFTKEQILEKYLNHVYFGNGIYGVEAAAQRFWNKSIKQISMDEAAVLAGIVQSPNKYCPLNDPQACEQRRNIVLNQIYKLNIISEKDLKALKSKHISIINKDTRSLAPHLKERLKIFLEELIGKEKLYNGGLKIYTTINLKTQELAEKTFKAHIKKYKEIMHKNVDGGLISIDGETGAIRAYIGGYNFQQSQFDRVKAKRQLGSTFKPIIYATGLMKGKNLFDTEVDEPTVFLDNLGREWSPKNFNNKFDGQMTLARALSHSNNIVSIKALLNTGIEEVIDVAYRCGIKGHIDPYPSMALGCMDGSISDAACMINIFAQNGKLVEPYFLKFIKDESNKKIWKYNPSWQQVLPSSIASQIGKTLTLYMERIQKRSPKDTLPFQTLGKTGTTNDSRTCWYTGSTPDITTSMYIGCDGNQSLGEEVLASRSVFSMWFDFVKSVGSSNKNFNFDPNLHEKYINEFTGVETKPDDPEAIPILI